MLSTTHDVSVKGKIRKVPSFQLDNAVIVTKGWLVQVAEIFDEYWLPADSLPSPHHVLQQMKDVEKKPDIFTFGQRVPDTEPRYKFDMEWDNVAVIPISSHDTWFREQISSASRRNIRASEKKGVVVRADQFDETYIQGIMSVFNESPVRHGKKYWHYGKDFATVKAENGTYCDRSTFLGAYFKDEMIGYMKIVWDTRSAAIMQILSKMAFLEKRPNNALISQAVRLCSERGIKHLLYERFVYGNKGEDSLTRFKASNGFIRMDLPRYYVPLTSKGSIAIKLRLHGDPKDLVPQRLRNRLVNLRDSWYTQPDECGLDPPYLVPLCCPTLRFAVSLNRPSRSPAMKLKQTITKAILLSVSLSIGVILCEAGARLILNPADYLSPKMIKDEVLGITIEPNRSGYDEWGFRNDNVPTTADVVAVGDSHTYGNTAAMSDSWPSAMARRTRLTVYNLGMGGYGPNQYYHLLTTKGLTLHPKWVLCGLYMGDDFENAFLITNGLDHWSSLRSGRWNDVDADIWGTSEPPVWGAGVRNWLSEHSMVYRLVIHGPLITMVKEAIRFGQTSVDNDPYTTALRVEDQNIREAFRPVGMAERLDQASGQIRRACELHFTY